MASNFSNGSASGGNPTPMTDADVTPPPATTDFEAAAPLKGADVEFESDPTDSANQEAGMADGMAGHAQAVRDGVHNLTGQAGEKALGLAEQGKERASGALDHLARMLTDAASQVDDKVGAQYGQYARTAADTVSGFAEQVRAKDVGVLVEDARTLVRKSPAIAVGTAAALGFVVARLVSAGIDNKDA